MLERNLLEVRRQLRRRERPRAREVRRREPAAGDQVVDRPVLPSRNTSLSVLLTHSSDVPSTSTIAGLARQQNQLRRLRADEHLRRLAGDSVLPGSAALTSFQFSSAGSFAKLAGSVPAGVQAPSRLAAFSQVASWRR